MSVKKNAFIAYRNPNAVARNILILKQENNNKLPGVSNFAIIKEKERFSDFKA